MQTRYIELIDDIRNHVFQWATDSDWRKLPPKINVALTTLMNELKISEAIKSAGASDVDEESIVAEKKRFVAIFRKKYLELTDFEFKEPITPVNQCNIQRVIQELKNHGGSYVEFLEWFFDDYCSLEENKKFLPPQINYLCSNFIVSKYLFIMKDDLKIRKNEIEQQASRTLVLEIALPMNERIKCKEFAKKILDLDNRVITPSKFLTLMKAFAVKYNDDAGVKACEELEAKIEEAKKKKK